MHEDETKVKDFIPDKEEFSFIYALQEAHTTFLNELKQDDSNIFLIGLTKEHLQQLKNVFETAKRSAIINKKSDDYSEFTSLYTRVFVQIASEKNLLP